MGRPERIEIARRVLELVARGELERGSETWETDTGRFIDENRFKIERDKLFFERPQLVALTADLPRGGSYYATEIAGLPVLLVRDRDGRARAFLNACRHRGVPVASGHGSAKCFVCPYHHWTYALDGALSWVPDAESFDHHHRRGLVPLPMVEQHGLIIVHPRPEGKVDFTEFLGPLGTFLADYGFDRLRLIQEHRALVRINWKHAVDGSLEGYHVPHLHPRTVAPLTLEQFVHLDFGVHQVLVSPHRDIVKLRNFPEDQWPSFPPFGITAAIFPNAVLGSDGVDTGVAFLQRSEPGQRAGECTYVFRTYGVGLEPSEEVARLQSAVSDLLMKTALEEDMRVQSAAQASMESGAVRSIVFGRREHAVVRMHRAYDRLSGFAPGDKE